MKNPITIVKQRMELPWFRKLYARNILTWFNKKHENIN